MREEECSGINCAEESYGAGCWLLRMASGADFPAQPRDFLALWSGVARGWLLRTHSRADLPPQPPAETRCWLLRMASRVDLPAQPPAETRGWLLRMASGVDLPAQPPSETRGGCSGLTLGKICLPDSVMRGHATVVQ